MVVLPEYHVHLVEDHGLIERALELLTIFTMALLCSAMKKKIEMLSGLQNNLASESKNDSDVKILADVRKRLQVWQAFH